MPVQGLGGRMNCDGTTTRSASSGIHTSTPGLAQVISWCPTSSLRAISSSVLSPMGIITRGAPTTVAPSVGRSNVAASARLHAASIANPGSHRLHCLIFLLKKPVVLPMPTACHRLAFHLKNLSCTALALLLLLITVGGVLAATVPPANPTTELTTTTSGHSTWLLIDSASATLSLMRGNKVLARYDDVAFGRLGTKPVHYKGA